MGPPSWLYHLPKAPFPNHHTEDSAATLEFGRETHSVYSKVDAEVFWDYVL